MARNSLVIWLSWLQPVHPASPFTVIVVVVVVVVDFPVAVASVVAVVVETSSVCWHVDSVKQIPHSAEFAHWANTPSVFMTPELHPMPSVKQSAAGVHVVHESSTSSSVCWHVDSGKQIPHSADFAHWANTPSVFMTPELHPMPSVKQGAAGAHAAHAGVVVVVVLVVDASGVVVVVVVVVVLSDEQASSAMNVAKGPKSRFFAREETYDLWPPATSPHDSRIVPQPFDL